MISVAIKTLDRSPAPNYLGRTLQNLARSGFWESEHLAGLVIVDSGSPDPKEYEEREIRPHLRFAAHDRWVFDSAPRTLHQTAAAAIRRAAENDAEWVLVLEDDIDVCDNFLGSVARWLEQHAGRSRMYAFGANYEQVRQAAAEGRTVWAYPVGSFYGAQALAWSRPDALDLGEWLGADPEFDGNRDRHHDLLLQRWARERGIRHVAASVPSFVQHIGAESTLTNEAFDFPSWPGREWSYVSEKPRRSLLWVGDACCSTGFARCTHKVCDALAEDGWDVRVLALNYYGDPHDYPYSIYPCRQPLDGGRDPYGVSRLPVLTRRLSPDAVVILNDAWNVPAYLNALDQAGVARPPTIGWIAVDGKNQDGSAVSGLDHVAVWTQFGATELRKGGYTGPISLVPLAVDPTLYSPRDRSAARSRTCPEQVAEDAFIVGVIGRNQPRKRLDLTLEYFATWIKDHGVDDALLYMHVAPTGELGCNIKRMVRYYGLSGRVIVSQPHVGLGVPESDLPWLYSSFDVYLTTTQGEGWGLPCIEAMACGVPCIVPDWSGLGEWTADAALKVPCSATALSAPLNDLAYTLGGVPDRDATVEALQRVYSDHKLRRELTDRGLGLASRYTWQETTDAFLAMLEQVLSEAPAEPAELEVAHG